MGWRTAQAEHGVVFFRDQELTPDGQLAAARRFGAINVNRFFTPVPEQPSVAMVLKEPQHETNVGGGWHTDHSYDDVPALGSLLYALEVPSRGGDTMFANMYSAYDALSPGLKSTLEGLRAVHSSRHVFGRAGYHAGRKDDRYHNPEAATQDAIHPMVIRHPRSAGPRSTSTRGSPCASTAGRTWNRAPCWTICTGSRHDRSTPAVSTGRSAASLSGTTGPPGTTR